MLKVSLFLITFYYIREVYLTKILLTEGLTKSCDI